MFGIKKRIRTVENMKEAQRNEATNDDYTLGMYNGLELALSVIQDRKADLLYCVREPQLIEEQEEQKIGRTVAHGVRKVGG